MLDRRQWRKLLPILLVILIIIYIWHFVQLNSSSLPTNLSKISLRQSNSSAFSYPILPQNDYQRLIDITFHFNILNLVCNDSHPPLLLVLVHSAGKNFAKRQTIRETWGQNDDTVKVLFMLGAVDASHTQLGIENENASHSDLVQGDFLDTYRNITYKHVMLFKYVIYYCPQAKYILKTDDDVFVNMPSMKSFLTADLSPFGARNLLVCTVRKNTKVMRSYRSKWRVSFREYGNRTYPTYCLGWNILYSPDVLFILYKQAQNSDYFWIDDIHITGTLAAKAHIFHTNIEPLVMEQSGIRYILNVTLSTRPFLYGPANMEQQDIKSLWNFVTSHATPSTITYYH